MSFTVVDVDTEIMKSLPKMILFVNPSSIRQSMRKLRTNATTLGGYTEEHWGNSYDTVSAAGTSLGFYVVNRFAGPAGYPLLPENSNLRGEQQSYLFPQGEVPPGRSQERATVNEDAVLKTLTYTDLRRQTAAYQNFLDLLEFFRANAALTNNQGKVVEYGMTRLTYEDVDLEGHFTNFNYRETAEKPALFEYDFTFEVFSQNWTIGVGGSQ